LGQAGIQAGVAQLRPDLIVHGVGYRPALLVAGVVLGTLLMLLVGFTSSLPFASVSDWFLAATIPLAVMNLPVLHYSGVWPTPLLYLIPTQGPLLLLGAAFDQVTLTPWQAAYAVVYPAVCLAGLSWAAKAVFGRYVIARGGL
jgi:fluoroquinolone transport system permease protein